MALTVPDPFVWDTSFQTFYDTIDDHHKAIFNGIVDCTKENTAANKKKLVDVVKNHFAHEDSEFIVHKYPEGASHTAAHNAFTAKLEAASVPLDDATVKFAKEWLVNHIKTIDFKYKGKLG
uniref:Hemerythrin n=1 Tax=Ancistrosyllis groenlandica TaxID=397539 RepID=A0A1S6QCD3_9ANNE|nr:hemerythrin [Ancistrosyllis groenlandica]